MRADVTVLEARRALARARDVARERADLATRILFNRETPRVQSALLRLAAEREAERSAELARRAAVE